MPDSVLMPEAALTGAGGTFRCYTPNEKTESALWLLDQPWVESAIPQRPWVVPGYLLRGSVTVVSGPGSAGKSSLMVAWAVSLATGLNYGRFQPPTAMKVASYNVEDDREEQQRRFSATSRQFNAPAAVYMKRLRIFGPREVGTLLKLGADGRLLTNTAAMDELKITLEQWCPDVVMLDPFVELHDSEENDNTAVRQVMARFRSWARTLNCAIVILHHARKGVAVPGDPDSLRGASAIVGAARVILTMSVMSDEEAANFGIADTSRRDYFRLDGAKVNYCRITDADWFQRIEYHLENGEGVAAAVSWQPPTEVITLNTLTTIEDGIARGNNGEPWANRGGTPRDVRNLFRACGIMTRDGFKKAIRHLEQQGCLVMLYKTANRTKAKGYRNRIGEPRSVNWLDGDEEAPGA